MQHTSNIAKEMQSAILGSFGRIAGGIGLLEIGKQSIMLASDLQEVANVVDVTFGSGANTINDWSKSALKSFGLSELQAKQFNGTLGALMKSSGISSDKLIDMSTALSGLSADFASFYNLDPAEAFDKIRAGISGETEPLKSLGINMSVANLEAYALTQGIKKSWKEMSQAEQVTLRYNYLMNASKDAQGDFARTNKGFANQLRIAKVTLQQLGATIGAFVLPVLNYLLIKFNDLLGFVPGISDVFKTLFSELSNVKSVKEGLYLIFGTLNKYLFKVAPNMSAIFSNVYNIISEFVGNILDDLIRIGGDLSAPFITAFNSIVGFIKTLGGTILDLFGSISKNSDMTGIFNVLRDTLGLVLSDITDVFNFFNDNWSVIAPIITGVGSALLIFNGITKGTEIAIASIKAVQTAWAVVTGLCSTAMAYLNGVLVISPLGWVAIVMGVVVGAGIALWQNWDVISSKASELWGTLTAVFSSIGQSISGVFIGIGSAVDGFVNKAVDGINSLINGLNSLASFKVPDWIPGVGGKSVGVSIPNIPQFATGTQYFSGGLAEVGEHGGEILNLPNGTQVIPADKTDKMLNGSSGVSLQVIVQGNVIGNHEFANEMGQIITDRLKVALINN